MAVQDSCRHYQRRSTVGGDAFERCRLDAAAQDPSFDCPDGCIFFELRGVERAGWVKDPRDGEGR
jgi:hypothetical protein